MKWTIRLITSKFKVARRVLIQALKMILLRPKYIINRAQSRNELYSDLSREFFITIAVLLLSCTCIDILRQSFSSGQFWNSIIVVACLSILLAWCVTLSLLRAVSMKRWMIGVPRRHQVGRNDVGTSMIRRIIEVRQRCVALFKNQMDFSEIEHAGLQNPLRRHGGTGGEGDIETPYWEFADSIPIFLEDNFSGVVPDYTLAPSDSLRDFLARAIDENVLDAKSIMPSIQRFLDLYEKLRYSGNSLKHAELIELMENFSHILNQVQQPELAGLYSSSRRTLSDAGPGGADNSQIFGLRPPPFGGSGAATFSISSFDQYSPTHISRTATRISQNSAPRTSFGSSMIGGRGAAIYGLSRDGSSSRESIISHNSANSVNSRISYASHSMVRRHRVVHRPSMPFSLRSVLHHPTSSTTNNHQ